MATRIVVNLPVKALDRSVRAICDARTGTEAIACLSDASRAEVDGMVAKAVSAGGAVPNESKDYGFMYGHGFEDLDGHLWEVMYMDPKSAHRS